MYEFISGNLVRIKDEYVVLENGGIGFKIFTTKRVLSVLELRMEYTFYTAFQVKEDAIALYGFLDEKDLDLYNLLTTVTGVGPKSALAILSELTGDAICRAISSNDIQTLTTAPGVGKKVASRLILELHDKVDKMTFQDFVEAPDKRPGESALAEEALAGLGFTKREIDTVMAEINPNLSVEEIIKLALKMLS